VDPTIIESRADEIVGPVSTTEHKALEGHLGGVRRNRVFHALGLSPPRHSAKVKLAEGQDAAPTGALEKAKRKHASSSMEPTKRSRVLDTLLNVSPLQSKGDSEDAESEDSHYPLGETTPPTPKVVVPLKTAPPCLDLEFSTAQESGDVGVKKYRLKSTPPSLTESA